MTYQSFDILELLQKHRTFDPMKIMFVKCYHYVHVQFMYLNLNLYNPLQVFF
mgnify:CR=1 FL=1